MRRAQPALGTLVEISILDTLEHEHSQAAFQAGFTAIHEIHRLMSFHDENSDISRYNRAAAGTVISVHEHTATVLAAALHLSALSEGLFDIRVAGRLVELNYLPMPKQYAAQPAAQSAMIPPPFIGKEQAYRLLPCNRVEKLNNDWLDLGGIAKGYAVDCAISALQAKGVQHACVNAGGDLRVLGQSQTVAIRDPRQPQVMAKQLSLSDLALATSACYFSRKELAGETVSALIDGSTGSAIMSDFSYTVLAPACLWADGLTKLVAASGNVRHPCLSAFAAEAFII